MAARKLKFKPKPSLNLLNIRRPKDTDEAANLLKEKALEKEKEDTFKSSDPVSEEIESGKLNDKIEVISSASESSDSLILGVGNQIVIKSKLSEDKLSLTVDPVSLISSQKSNSAIEKCLTEEGISPVSDIVSTNLDNSVSTVTVVDSNVSLNSIISLVVDSTDKPKIISSKPGSGMGKGPTRFGRSRYKPVLSNPDLRKKIDAGTSSSEVSQASVEPAEEKPKDNSDVTNSLTNKELKEEHIENSGTLTNSTIHQLNNQRTESVIKSVKSELSKSQSIIEEITESFTLLESTDDELLLEIRNCARDKHGRLSSTENPDYPSTSLSSVGSSENTAVAVRLEIKQSNSPKKVPVSPLKATSKVLVPKPSPRISEISPRRISFQSSDSEEEVKKKKSYRKRENSKFSNEPKEKNSQTKRKRSQGSTYSKMSQETLDKFSKKFGKDEEPDKTKLTMIDLIFYNPKNNPMPQSTQNKPKKKEKSMEINEAILEKIEEEKEDDVEPAAVPVPQLKIGPDGQIMLDPQSLVIETTGTEKGREKLEKSEVIQDTGITRYSTYRKKRQIRSDWSRLETLQFFRALNTVGTDFTLMTKLFPNRSRHELKLKFKREERVNLRLVDRAMIEKVDFDFNALQEDFRHENDVIRRKNMEKKLAAEAAQKERAIKKEEMMKNKEKRKNISYKGKVSKAKALKDFNETDQGNYERIKSEKRQFKRESEKHQFKRKTTKVCKKESGDSGVEEQLHIDFDSSSDYDDDEEDISILNVVKQTRFGRLPKRSSKLEEYEEINETLKKRLQHESDTEEDGYIPNGPDAQMLFGTPLPDSAPAELEEHHELMDFQITSVPSIEETVLRDENLTDVSEISELGSFGQNDSALDLTLPMRSSVGTRLYSQRPDIDPLLNSQMIAQSFQIVDQLTSNVQSNEVFCDNKGNVGLIEAVGDDEVQPKVKIPLPSFESVSHARPSMMYPIEANRIPMDFNNTQNEVILHDNAGAAHGMLVNFYNSTEDYAQEVIIGD